MNDLTERNFGYLIAYVLPGFVVLWGIRPLSPTIDGWLSPSPSFPAGIEAIVFVGIASIAMGMTVSAARWLLIDSLHACTGIVRPDWNDAKLSDRLAAFESIVDAHYRYYQFNANMAVALPIAFIVVATAERLPAGTAAFCWVGFVAAECLFFITSRDNLRKYYRRVSLLLGEITRKEVRHVQRSRKA